MTSAEAAALAIVWGIGLGFSIHRQMVLQWLATQRRPGAGIFTRVTQFVLSCTLLVGASLLSRDLEAVTTESFMFLLLAAAFVLVWTQRATRSRLIRS